MASAGGNGQDSNVPEKSHHERPAPATVRRPPAQVARRRVAIVGTGYFSQFHYAAWQRLARERDLQLVGCCSLEIERAREMAAAHGIAAAFVDFDDMIAVAAPDLVDIVTPPATHAGLIGRLAASGIDAICQKPFTTSLAQARELAGQIEAAGVCVFIHENFRYQPWHGEIGSLIKGGAIGELYQITFRLRPGDGQGPDAYLDRQPYFQQMPRFLIHETAIHFVDVFRALCGEVRSVSAELRRINPVIAGEDAGIVVLSFESGAIGVIDANRSSDHIARNRRQTMGEMLVEGSRGVLRLDGDGMIYLRQHGENTEVRHTFSWEDIGFGGNSVYRLQAAVLDALSGTSPPVNLAHDYLRNLEIEDAIYRSNAEGRRITL